MKKIFMSGCGGMLGEAFYQVFKNSYELKCTDIDLNEEWIEYMDFRDINAYSSSVKNFQPDYLFHIGAHTDLEYCENNIKDTYLTNTTSVENAVYISNSLNIPLLFISTAGIFDGKKEFYDEWDTPNPLCHYARSKYAGEEFVLRYSTFPIVLRAGWMMGGGPSKSYLYVMKHRRQDISNDSLCKLYVGLKQTAKQLKENGFSSYEANEKLADMVLVELENKVLEEI